MSDLKPELLTMAPEPMRSADEQWRVAGFECSVYAVLDEEGIVFVNGKGGRCVMRGDEWTAYQRRCLESAPSVAMLKVSEEEAVELLSLMQRPRSCFQAAFERIERLMMAHETCLHEDEREDMRRTMAGKLLTLKEAVLRAEEIWSEGRNDECRMTNDEGLRPEDKVFICPGCAKPVRRYELNSVTDRRGHWHGACEQAAWAAVLKEVGGEGGAA